MIRVAVIADSHWDEAPGGRFEECVRLHDWIADDLASRGVDAVLHSGDLFERRSTPKERRAVADWLRRVADFAPVLIVRGNHDAAGDLPIFERLRTRHPVRVEEAAMVHVVADVVIGCLAWPRKGEILSRLGHDVPQEAAGQAAVEALRAVLVGLGAHMEAQAAGVRPRLLLSHAMVRGSRVSTGQPLAGCDFELGLEDLALARADAYLLGHVHAPQDWRIGDAPAIYPGSPRRTAFGEVEEKGYVVLELEPGQPVRWERVPTPATPMLLLEGEYVGTDGASFVDAIAFDADAEIAPGAEVRVRYLVAADERDAGRRAAAKLRDALLAKGAAHVKVEEQVVATVKARAPEIAAAKTLAEKLVALWAVRGDELDDERRARLLARVVWLEEEARDVA